MQVARLGDTLHNQPQFLNAQYPAPPTKELADTRTQKFHRHLVLRTYADSEPWIEVFRKGRKYEVVERIT